MSSGRAGTGRVSETFTCKTVSGGTSGSFQKASWNSSARPAPAWEADGRPIYGGFFWINSTGAYPIPKDAYYMAGAGNQKTFIIPSHDMVVVRLGHYKGSSPGDEDLKRALALLIEAVPETR